LVASIAIGDALFGNTQYTYRIPFVPELNEFYAREMLFDYDKLRVELERIGIIIDAADHDNTFELSRSVTSPQSCSTKQVFKPSRALRGL
jgi:hypothetical protein